MFIGDNHILARVEVSDEEKKIIEEVQNEESFYSNGQP